MAGLGIRCERRDWAVRRGEAKDETRVEWRAGCVPYSEMTTGKKTSEPTNIGLRCRFGPANARTAVFREHGDCPSVGYVPHFGRVHTRTRSGGYREGVGCVPRSGCCSTSTGSFPYLWSLPLPRRGAAMERRRGCEWERQARQSHAFGRLSTRTRRDGSRAKRSEARRDLSRFGRSGTTHRRERCGGVWSCEGPYPVEIADVLGTLIATGRAQLRLFGRCAVSVNGVSGRVGTYDGSLTP